MSSVANHEVGKSAPILSGPAESREFPDWFHDQQRAAWKQFESLPNPTRKDQAWRFANVSLLDLTPFKISGPLSEDDRRNILKYSRGLDEYAARMIFANDQLIERDVVSEDLKKRGVIFQPLERALVEHADLFRKYFMSTEATLGSAKFAALHKALVSSGAFLYLPRGVEIEQPIEIFHWLRHDNIAIFPHLLLVTDELAKVTVIEHFRSYRSRQTPAGIRRAHVAGSHLASHCERSSLQKCARRSFPHDFRRPNPGGTACPFHRRLSKSSQPSSER